MQSKRLHLHGKIRSRSRAAKQAKQPKQAGRSFASCRPSAEWDQHSFYNRYVTCSIGAGRVCFALGRHGHLYASISKAPQRVGNVLHERKGYVNTGKETEASVSAIAIIFFLRCVLFLSLGLNWFMKQGRRRWLGRDLSLSF